MVYSFSRIKLAQNFSFEIKKQGNEILLLAPGAAKLESIVSKVNKVLIRKGQDPIVYLPVHTGFLNAAEILKLSVSAQEPFVTYAPYAENDEATVVHEIAWHLGAMLLPKKFHENSRAIDLEIIKLADRVRKSNLFGCEWVAQHLLEIRSLELDGGNADFVASLAGLRERSAMGSYQSIASSRNVPWKFLQNSLRYLARPGLTPQEVAIMHLKNLISFGAFSDIPLEKNFVIFPAQQAFNLSVPRYLYNEWIQNLINDPFYAEAVKSTKDNAEIWVKEIFEYMDKRIDQLNIAFREVK